MIGGRCFSSGMLPSPERGRREGATSSTSCFLGVEAMTKARRLFVVGALLAAAAIVSSSWTMGEPAAEKKGGRAPRVKAPAKAVDEDAEKALAASRFESGGAISYEPLKGEPY